MRLTTTSILIFILSILSTLISAEEQVVRKVIDLNENLRVKELEVRKAKSDQTCTDKNFHWDKITSSCAINYHYCDDKGMMIYKNQCVDYCFGNEKRFPNGVCGCADGWANTGGIFCKACPTGQTAILNGNGIPVSCTCPAGLKIILSTVTGTWKCV